MKKIMIIICIVLIVILILLVSINIYIINKTKSKIINVEESSKLEDVDCILILGARVINEVPSHMLQDRLLKGIEVYKNHASNKIIMSGDNTRKNYDEVNVMKKFAINEGVESENIFMDHAGISTYDSIYRAKDIFSANKIIIVTQKYHLYRALYIAEKLGIEAYGVDSEVRKYVGQTKRDIREFLARDKEFIKCIIKPASKYKGEKISLKGDGNITNDK